MSGRRAAIRYAKAVLELAKEQDTLKATHDEMLSIYMTLDQSEELQAVLHSPMLSIQQKKEALLEVFKQSSALVKNLFEVLASNKRLDILQEVTGAFHTMYNEAQGIVEAKVTTAVPMDAALEEKVLNKIKELTKAENVSLQKLVDASVIGGFVLRVGDVQYDASMANSFGKLKKRFQSSI